MKLVIVESPAKAKTIEKYLESIDPSGDFVVRASVGHVRDLPKSNKKAIDIPAGFVPHYEVVPGKQPVNEQMVYHVLTHFLNALMNTGVGVCGGSVVKPLAGRTEAIGTRN